MATKPYIGAYIPPDLKKLLEKAAKKDHRSTSSMVVKILSEYLTGEANGKKGK